jgi:Tfp pilus assembly protein FimT
MRSGSQSSGFSLIELVGVVSTVLVLVAMAVPSLTRSSQVYRLSAQLRAIEGELQNVRFTAINRNRPASLLFSTDGTWCFPDVDGSGTISGNEQAIWGTPGGFTLNCPAPSPALTAANLGTTLDPILLPNRGVAFTPRGTVVQVSSSQTPTSAKLSAPVVVYLRDSQNNYAAVTLTPAGRIRSWVLSGTSWK